MRKSDLLYVLQAEIRRHTFDTFVDEPPSVAQGGTGVVVPGCTACRKRLYFRVSSSASSGKAALRLRNATLWDLIPAEERLASE